MKSGLRTVIYFVAAVLVTAFVASAVTLNIVNAKKTDEVVMSSGEYARISDLLAFNELIDKLNSNAFYEVPARDALIEAASRGIVDSLGDDYAEYYTAKEYEDYLSNINGEYSGIGILVGVPDEEGATVLDVYDDTPAMEAGLVPGDIIVEVDGETVAGLELTELAAMMQRDAGEHVALTAKRNGEMLTFDLVCAKLNIRRVDHALFKESTGYIRLSMFTGNCVEEFREALEDLKERGMKSLVIDLRDNPGGSLDSVVEIADMLLPECTIVSVRGKLEAEGEVFRSNRKSVSVPMAVIVNEDSASASEILASAVKENGAGKVVGMQTYGKGIVQTTYPLESNGGFVKMTTDGYYTPDGNSIHGVGVTPDIEVDLPEDMELTPIDELEQADDAQLWAALDYVRGIVNGTSED